MLTEANEALLNKNWLSLVVHSESHSGCKKRMKIMSTSLVGELPAMCFTNVFSQVETGMTYDRDQIRKWLLLGGSKCPLTGVQLVTRKVGSHRLKLSCSRAERAKLTRQCITCDIRRPCLEGSGVPTRKHASG